MRSALLGSVGTAMAASLHLSASGVDIMVPSPGAPTLQAAIDAAAPLDRILIAPGVHAMPAGPIAKPLTIEGIGGALGCVLDGGGASTVLLAPVIDLGKGTLVLRGVTVRSGRAWTAASGTLQIERCRFLENGRDEDAGGALAVLAGATLRVVDSVFERNRSCCGGAIYCHFAPARLEATGCVFLDNSSPFEGGAIHFTSSSSTLDACAFSGNSAPLGGAILRWNGNGNIPAAGCQFSLNTSNWNCCVTCTGCSEFNRTAFLQDCDDDGIGDGIGMLLEPWRNANGNGIPDACECLGDFVKDGVVNGADAAVLLNYWALTGAGASTVDLDGDGIVGAADLAILLNNWGACSN